MNKHSESTETQLLIFEQKLASTPLCHLQQVLLGLVAKQAHAGLWASLGIVFTRGSDLSHATCRQLDCNKQFNPWRYCWIRTTFRGRVDVIDLSSLECPVNIITCMKLMKVIPCIFASFWYLHLKPYVLCRETKNFLKSILTSVCLWLAIRILWSHENPASKGTYLRTCTISFELPLYLPLRAHEAISPSPYISIGLAGLRHPGIGAPGSTLKYFEFTGLIL